MTPEQAEALAKEWVLRAEECRVCAQRSRKIGDNHTFDVLYAEKATYERCANELRRALNEQNRS